MNGKTAEVYHIWIDMTERIASFRMVEGYELKSFSNNDYFMTFLQGLQETGYRFQERTKIEDESLV